MENHQRAESAFVVLFWQMVKIFRLLILLSLFLPRQALAAAPELEQLLLESQQLFAEGRLIDAREKLQQAVRIDPKDFRAFLMLGTYYLSEVGHFRLAERYITTAEKNFYEANGKDPKKFSPQVWSQHARLLFLKSETQLNLDKYQASLTTLDEFGARYWDDWYPGTRAWVLMKLRRNEEAIATAQTGLLRGAELGRTYNILGILLSITGQRELSLDAFENAIRAEYISGSRAQIATPLNNAGEVYREMFRDREAEAAFASSLRFPDGCDHILPSLNLAILQVDELRLFQAERVLSDFEACYAQRALKSDTEHKVLLELMRGKIALRAGRVNQALKLIKQAAESEQWFGKIGTNENDVRLASYIALADAYGAQAKAWRDHVSPTIKNKYNKMLTMLTAWTRAKWYNWRARQYAFEDVEDFEDLYVRHTDAMLEYPTLGHLLADYPSAPLSKRMSRLLESDPRPGAHTYYQLWLAQNAIANGEKTDAATELEKIKPTLRKFDHLVQAEFLTAEYQIKPEPELACAIFETNPSHLRYADGKLPVQFSLSGSSELREQLKDFLKTRFVQSNVCHYRVELNQPADGGAQLQFVDTNSGQILVTAETRQVSDKRLAQLTNKFIAKVFQHKVDPPAEPLPELPILKGIL